MLRTRMLMLIVALAGCDGTEKLDEAMLYEGPEFTLKLVRYYERLFLHFNGEVYSIQCRSAATRNYQALSRQEAGWRAISNGSAIGSTNAKEVADLHAHRLVIAGPKTLVYRNGGVSVSFDACGSFGHWHPTKLPLELIDQIDKPEWCAPQGGGDCRHYDFLGDRAPTIEGLQVDPSGRISFLARSPAFFESAGYWISSEDSGRTWAFASAAERSDPD